MFQISSASTNGGSILESLSEEDLASMAATSAVEDDGAGGIISSGRYFIQAHQVASHKMSNRKLVVVPYRSLFVIATKPLLPLSKIFVFN